MQIGAPGGRARHGDVTDQATLSDLFVRVGGATAGMPTTGGQIDSARVLLDNSWIWRADHGAGSDGTPAIDHGLIVNGDDVRATGLFAEHWQKQQVIWNGQRGRPLFHQSEMPEHMPDQAAWINGSTEGAASYTRRRRATRPSCDRPGRSTRCSAPRSPSTPPPPPAGRRGRGTEVVDCTM